MKKAIVLLCGFLLVSGLYAETNKMTIGLNFGTITNQDFTFDPILWTAGAELDIPLGNSLFLCPEATLIGYGFEFKDFILFPAATLNVTFSSFFAGGGLTKGFYIGSGSTTDITDFSLKVNAGLISDKLKITVYIITPFDGMFDAMFIGATLGFRL